ncbi:hypothetical protein KZ466_07045, partial [Glaesserella parasuis]|nr:hypothetical protein [Glaesserella parasuis]
FLKPILKTDQTCPNLCKKYCKNCPFSTIFAHFTFCITPPNKKCGKPHHTKPHRIFSAQIFFFLSMQK